jgi:hypothetical protein
MPGRLPTAVLAAVALELMFATSAAAGTVTYQDGVFRYRDQPQHSGEVSIAAVRPAKADGTPGRLRGSASAPLATGPGCRAAPSDALGGIDDFVCVLAAPGLPRYRLSLGDRDDRAGISAEPLRGVIYGGPGRDGVDGAAWRVYGGRGNDSLNGQRVYGGPGDDELDSGVLSEDGLRSVLRGGTGDDHVDVYPGPGWAYGGPGNDDLFTSPRRDMLVGGPGFDEIVFIDINGDTAADTFRIRDGRHDYVECPENGDPKDVFFADRSDEFNDAFSDVFNNRCEDARVLFSGRPQVFPYSVDGSDSREAPRRNPSFGRFSSASKIAACHLPGRSSKRSASSSAS